MIVLKKTHTKKIRECLDYEAAFIRERNRALQLQSDLTAARSDAAFWEDKTQEVRATNKHLRGMLAHQKARIDALKRRAYIAAYTPGPRPIAEAQFAAKRAASVSMAEQLRDYCIKDLEVAAALNRVSGFDIWKAEPATVAWLDEQQRLLEEFIRNTPAPIPPTAQAVTAEASTQEVDFKHTKFSTAGCPMGHRMQGAGSVKP